MIAVHSPSSEEATQLADAIHEELARDNLKAVFIGSADLTHYGPNYGFSPMGVGTEAVAWVKDQNDRSIVERATAMDAAGVLSEAWTHKNTCSAGPIASVIASAAALGIERGKLLEYYTSYDVMPNSSFVGYAAIVY